MEGTPASSSPNSAVSSFQVDFAAAFGSGGGATNECGEAERASSRANDEEENGPTRKKLRLSKEQSAYLEESFKEHNTLNPKQKLALAKQLNLRPRQVERREMAEEHRCQASPEGPRLCANNCGFFGSPATQGLCSKCYRDHRLKEDREAAAKMAVEKSLQASSPDLAASSYSISAATAPSSSASADLVPSLSLNQGESDPNPIRIRNMSTDSNRIYNMYFRIRIRIIKNPTRIRSIDSSTLWCDNGVRFLWARRMKLPDWLTLMANKLD